jgi:hypothetical protein
MPGYTFTVSQTFALALHEVFFTSDRIKINNSSSGLIVYDKDFSNGIAFRCVNDDFQVGTLQAASYLTKSIDITISTAALWLYEKPSANRFIGTTDPADESIYHIFDLNQCPVKLSRKNDLAVMACPCDGTPCTNGCYQYGF